MQIAATGRQERIESPPVPRADRPLAAAPRQRPGERQVHDLRAGQVIPTGATRSPAGELVRARGRDLLAIPGAVSVSWRGGDDVAVVRLNFHDEAGASLGKALLERRVDGVELVVGVWGEKEPHAGDGVGRTGDLVRAVAAMPGIWDYRYRETSPFADGHVTFQAISRAVVDRLDPLLRDSIPFGTAPDGRARMMHLHWRAGVPARA